jgi:hypothetical protein
LVLWLELSNQSKESGMRRHKPIASTVQLNLRVTPQVFRELEVRANAQGVTVSELVRRAIDTDQSLSAFLNRFEPQMRDAAERGVRAALERGARGSADTDLWRRLATFGAKLRAFYTDMEELFLPDMANPEIRTLLRGAPAPALPGETKASKVTQRE